MLLAMFLITVDATAQKPSTAIWRIGKSDRSASEFALAADGFNQFIEHDIGFEDKFLLVGYSNDRQNFTYVLPGPADIEGGTWLTSGY